MFSLRFYNDLNNVLSIIFEWPSKIPQNLRKIQRRNVTLGKAATLGMKSRRGSCLVGWWRGASVTREDVTNIHEHFRFPTGSLSVLFNVNSNVFWHVSSYSYVSPKCQTFTCVTSLAAVRNLRHCQFHRQRIRCGKINSLWC